MREVQKGIHAFQPVAFGGRLNKIPVLCDWQAASLRWQIHRAAQQIGLRDPLFFYTWFQRGMFRLCTQMKRSHFMVHMWWDHPHPPIETEFDRFVAISDRTLIVLRSDFHRLKAKFGSKVEMMPQAVDFTRLTSGVADPEATAFQPIPRPRIGYLGYTGISLSRPLLQSVFTARPEWHFISVGDGKAVPLPNVHAVPWAGQEDLPRYIRSLDVGFLPYDFAEEWNFYRLPMKVYEYFALGIPVVSTPLIHLWEYKDLIYLGDSAEELATAIQSALNEPPDSPKRAARIEIARKHSLECLAGVLRRSLPLEESSAA
jgi:glycosyltransferase involved in cell wall biosynthesis